MTPAHGRRFLRGMNKALLPVCALALVLCGCGPAEKEELQGRPLVYQLGAKISTASTAQELDALLEKLATAKLSAGSREHLGKAIEEQHKLLAPAAALARPRGLAGLKKILAAVAAAAAAVEKRRTGGRRRGGGPAWRVPGRRQKKAGDGSTTHSVARPNPTLPIPRGARTNAAGEILRAHPRAPR